MKESSDDDDPWVDFFGNFSLWNKKTIKKQSTLLKKDNSSCHSFKEIDPWMNHEINGVFGDLSNASFDNFFKDSTSFFKKPISPVINHRNTPLNGTAADLTPNLNVRYLKIDTNQLPRTILNNVNPEKTSPRLQNNSFKRRKGSTARKWIDDIKERWNDRRRQRSVNPHSINRKTSFRWRQDSLSSESDWDEGWDNWCKRHMDLDHNWLSGPLSTHLDFARPFRCLESRPISIIVATTDDSDQEAYSKAQSKPKTFVVQDQICQENLIPIAILSSSEEETISAVLVSGSCRDKMDSKDKEIAIKRQGFQASHNSDLTQLDYPATSLKRRPPVDKKSTCGKYKSFTIKNAKPSTSTASDFEGAKLIPIAIERDIDHNHIPYAETDRRKFFENLTGMLDKGDACNNRSFEEEECVENETPCGSKNVTRRNNNILWRSKLSELIWLELRAWLHGTTLRQQDEALSMARDGMSIVLERIVTFEIPKKELDYMGLKLGLPTNLGLPDILIAVQKENDLVIKQAFSQVESLLQALDEFESLFPNTASIAKHYPLYADRAFGVRVKTLCLWYNVINVLKYKIRALGDILYLNLFPSLKWPFSPEPQPFNGPSPSYDRFDSYSSFNIWDSLSNSPSSERFFTPPELGSPVVSTSIYRLFIEKSVRQGPLSKVIFRLTKLLHATLQKTRAALNGNFPQFEDGNKERVGKHGNTNSDKTDIPNADLESHDDPSLSVANLMSLLDAKYGCNALECDYYKHIQQYGVHSHEFRAMQLPTFRTTFLFVARIPLDIVHEWLRLRIQQKPPNLSFLSANQLMRECKEVLKAAVLIRYYYCTLVKAIFMEGEDIPEPCLKNFDDDLKCMLSLYLQYLDKLVVLTPENTDHTQVTLLEQEWKFIKMICPYILDKEVEAGKKICALISKLLETIIVALKDGVEECLEHFQYWWQLSSELNGIHNYRHYNSLNSANTTICSSCNSNVGSNSNYSSLAPDSITLNDKGDFSSERSDFSKVSPSSEELSLPSNQLATTTVDVTHRDFRAMFTDAKERSCKILGLTRVVRQDLEFASSYTIVPGKEFAALQSLFVHNFVALAFTCHPPPVKSSNTSADVISDSSAHIIRCSSPAPLVRVTSKKRPLTSKHELAGGHRSTSFRKVKGINNKSVAPKEYATIMEGCSHVPTNSSYNEACDDTINKEKSRLIPLQKYDSVPTDVLNESAEVASFEETKFWVFIPCAIAKDTQVISKLLNMDCHRETASHLSNLESELNEYLVMMPKSRDSKSNVWPGKTFYVDICSEIWKSFSAYDWPCLVLLGKSASALAKQRTALEKVMGDAIRLQTPQTSFHSDINDALLQLKTTITKFEDGIINGTRNLLAVLDEMNQELEQLRRNSAPSNQHKLAFRNNFASLTLAYEQKLRVKESFRDILAYSFDLGFDYFRDSTKTISPCCPLCPFSLPCSGVPSSSLTALSTGLYLPEVAEGIMEFARMWSLFAIKNYEIGHGRKPRWALQGLNFLKMAADPSISCYISTSHSGSTSFTQWANVVKRCVQHVIGQKSEESPSQSSKQTDNRGGPFNFSKFQPTLNRFLSDNTKLENKETDAIKEIEGDYCGVESVFRGKSDDRGLRKGLPPRRNMGNLGYHRNLSWPPTESPNRMKIRSNPKTILLTTSEKDFNALALLQQQSDADALADIFENMSKIEKVRYRVLALDEAREHHLQERGVIGKMSDRTVEDTFLHTSSRRVHFRWQRGIKIGQGQSGKVYTAVNMESGELMAMKEIRLHPNNDHQVIKEVADEIKLFENVRHPNLVRYYGIEVHREEMLIFMEYCGGGTLQDAARTGQLPDYMVRKYTRELLLAVNKLHDCGIVHRDIKGANIYLCSSTSPEPSKCNRTSSPKNVDPTIDVSKDLTEVSRTDLNSGFGAEERDTQEREEASLKLGDFGSAAKLKNFFTVPGEVKGLVGTPPFMAPEVINRCEGNGRAADVWSLGCVLIQMLIGRPPWSELENMFQIMYKVGSGQSPPIPENASEEVLDFLRHCFEVDTRLRWSAAKLLEHPFPKGGKI